MENVWHAMFHKIEGKNKRKQKFPNTEQVFSMTLKCKTQQYSPFIYHLLFD